MRYEKESRYLLLTQHPGQLLSQESASISHRLQFHVNYEPRARYVNMYPSSTGVSNVKMPLVDYNLIFGQARKVTPGLFDIGTVKHLI